MTANEICKALECCSTEATVNTFETCDGCPYREHDNRFDCNCIQQMCNDAVALIKKQQEKIERFEALTEKLKERTKGILLDEQTIAEIIDEVFRSKMTP